ncbi:hydrolase, partial [Yersinia enterocolitica]|uniref:hydrolase n=2 Tax=Yersinia enterocolitica TaxID=630 RepID=UPI00338E3F6E
MAVTEEATQPNEPNNSAGRVRICYHNRWITACSILFSSVATIFAWVLVLQLTMKQGFLSYIGLSSQYFLKQPNSLKDPLTLHHIGELVANGTILSLDDLWSFQSSFYQTIITVLIAINAILGAFAFFMIKHSSNAKAREEAILEVKSYVESRSFDKEVKGIIYKKIEAVQLDMNSQIQLVEEMIANFEDVNSRIETMDLRIVELENNNK